MTRAPLLARLLRRWHRRIGLFAALFFAFLAASGLALNHGEDLALDTTRIATPAVMAWYGLKPSVPRQAYALGAGTFTWQGDVWVLNGVALKSGHGEPVGVAQAAGMTWIATAEALRLYDPTGHPVDTIERDLLPGAPIRRLGVREGRLTAAIGNAIYASSDGIAWERLPGDASVIWSRMSPLDEAQQRNLAPLFAPSLPLQRVVADLHSGRIFGRYGVLVTDGVAIGLMLLAASGAWLYWKSRPSRPTAKPRG